MDHFAEVDWLAEHLHDPNVAIVDARSAPLGMYYASLGREHYLVGHIPGAVHLDYAIDLHDPATPYAARVASPQRFAEVVGNVGIGDTTAIIAYDSGDEPYAARMIWMLHYYGHDQAAILAGGIEAWIAAGLPRTSEVPSPDIRRFTPRLRPQLRATRDEVVELATGRSEAQLLSVFSDRAYAMRDREIAGARRLAPSLLLDASRGGRLAPVEQLRRVTADLDPQKRT
ncbi:MAG: sulfurtransferase, partial [Vulcanimicrobiaceae bacterium]